MKKLLLWLVMVVVMLAVLLGGAGYAMYAMTGDDKLPTQHPTLGDTELEPIGYDWSVPVLGNVLNRTFEQPSTLTVQKLGEMTEAAPELVLPDWAQRTTLTLKDSTGSVVVQGDAAAFAMYAYPKNGSYELTLTAYRNTVDPGDATGWYRYCASYTMNIQPKAVLSSERVSQGGVAALVITGILDGSEPTVETDLGDVWFRPVTGGYMGYIPVTYNAEGGPHTLTVTCGSLTRDLTLTVTNTGRCAGAEIVQLYVAKPDAKIFRPAQELKGFAKVWLEAGESKTVTIPLDDKAFRYWNIATDGWEVEGGKYLIRVGASSDDICLTGEVTVPGTGAPNPYQSVELPHYLTGEVTQVSDAEFAALLGRPIPEDKIKIDRNMTLGELGHGRSPLGWIVAAVLGQLLRQSIQRGKPDLNILFQYNMPLRALAKMTNGAISMGMVDGIVMEAQGFWIIGLLRVIVEAVKNIVLNAQMENRLKNS